MPVENDLFAQINHAVLDLQAATLQTYERPLKTLARLLQHPSLAEANQRLTEGVDVEAFLAEIKRNAGGVGGGAIAWPDDPRSQLALVYLLIVKMAAEAHFPINFGHQYFGGSSPKVIEGIRTMTGQMIIPFVRDYKTYIYRNGSDERELTIAKSNTKVFIVHGHDGEAKEKVARFLSSIGLVPIILHEQANRGRTIIEKIEANADVGFAVVLLTPDDEGRAKNGATLQPRARQNVLLELGYFIARLRRENVCALRKGEVDIPSDFAGVVWEPMDDSSAWKQSLGKELDAAGYNIDWNKVMRS